MTRDGAVEENKATGDEGRISKRDAEPNFTKPQDVHAPLIQPEKLLKPPLPLSRGGAAQETGTAERVIDRLDTEHTRHKSKKQIRKENEKIRQRGENSRLEFTDAERADPALSTVIRKSDKAADKLDKARDKIPKQKRIAAARTFDEATGKSKVRLRFEETDKKPPGKIKHKPAFLDRPAREAGVAVHSEIHKVEHENAGVEGAHKTEQLGEKAAGYTSRKLKEGYRKQKLKPYRAAAKAEDKAFKAMVRVKVGYKGES